MFSLEEFMKQPITAPTSTARPLLPAQRPLLARLGALEIAPWSSEKGSGFRLVIPMLIDDEEARKVMNRDEVRHTASIMLDITDKGELDSREGRNITFGQLRSATGTQALKAPLAELLSAMENKVVKVLFRHKNGREDIAGFSA